MGNQEKKRKLYKLDIFVWVLWVVLMWGFLAVLTIVDSPKNAPGIHEIIIIGYFLGFSIIFACIYLMILKKR